MVTPARAAKPPPGKPAAGKPAAPQRGRRLATRIGIGCGGLLVVAFIALILIGRWLWKTTGPQFPTQRIATSEASGVVHLGDVAVDPGTKALLNELATRFQRAQQQMGQEIPAGLRWFQSLRGSPDAASSIDWFLPREATVTIDMPEQGGFEFVAAVNLRAFTQLVVQLVRGGSPGPPVPYHEGEVINLEKGAAGVYQGTLVFASNAADVQTAIDRLRATDAPTPPAVSDIAVSLVSPLTTQALMMAGISSGVAVKVDRFDGTLDVVSADQVHAHLKFQSDDPQALAALEHEVRSFLEWAEARYEDVSPTLAIEQHIDEKTLTTDVTASGLAPLLDAVVAAAIAEGAKKRAPTTTIPSRPRRR